MVGTLGTLRKESFNIQARPYHQRMAVEINFDLAQVPTGFSGVPEERKNLQGTLAGALISKNELRRMLALQEYWDARVF